MRRRERSGAGASTRTSAGTVVYWIWRHQSRRRCRARPSVPVLVRYMSINTRVPEACTVSHAPSSVPVLSTHGKIIVHDVLPVRVVSVATVNVTLCWRRLHGSSVPSAVSKHVAGLSGVVVGSVQALLLHPRVIIRHPRGDLGICWLRGIRRTSSAPPTEPRGDRGGSGTVRKILHCFSKFGLKTEISVSIYTRECF